MDRVLGNVSSWNCALKSFLLLAEGLYQSSQPNQAAHCPNALLQPHQLDRTILRALHPVNIHEATVRSAVHVADFREIDDQLARSLVDERGYLSGQGKSAALSSPERHSLHQTIRPEGACKASWERRTQSNPAANWVTVTASRVRRHGRPSVELR